LDREGRVITTAVTNMDLHDLGRLARTYGLARCYVVQPLELQGRLVKRLMAHWLTGPGASYNPTRQEAFELLALVQTLDQAVEEITAAAGERPRVVATTARWRQNMTSFADLRERMSQGRAWLIVFGTGWGLAPEFFDHWADVILEPIALASEYNHLSVRTAAAIVIDRLCGTK
jgi:hypothetical protein